MALQLHVDLVLVEAQLQGLQHVDQRVGGALELDHLAGQLIDPAGHRGVAAEELVLDLVDVVLQPGHDRRVLVDDLIQDRVEHRLRPEARAAPGSAPAGARTAAQVGRLGVPDGDDEVRADEHVQLAELDLLHIVEVAGRAQHREQGVAVPLQLGPLMRGDRVLNGQPCSSNSCATDRSSSTIGRYSPIHAMPFRSRSSS